MTDAAAAIMQWDDPDADRSLPAWTYADADFHAVELARIFRPSWQIVCHESDIPAPGDYHLLDYIGEQAKLVKPDGFQLSKIPGPKFAPSDLANLPAFRFNLSDAGEAASRRLRARRKRKALRDRPQLRFDR